MMVLDGLEGKVRNVKLRPRGPESRLTRLVDYVQFCGAAATDKEAGVYILGDKDRVSVQHLAEIRTSGAGVVVDVRTETEMEICSLDNSVNVPITDLKYEGNWDKIREKLSNNTSGDMYVICRRGNDSQIATGLLRKILPDINIRDVIGGLHAWTKHIDKDFPVY